MSKPDKAVSLAVLGAMPPVLLMLLFWWGSIPFVDERLIPAFAAFGLFAGLALDFTVLKRFVFRLFALPIPAIAAVGFCYSVLVYGFFMGFPVCNGLVGVAAGAVAARACVLQGLSESEAKRRVGTFNLVFLAILFALCVCSAVLALNEPTIGAQIKGMLGLSFHVTPGMVWALILVGGALLLAFQFLCASLIARRVLRSGRASS